MENIILEMSQEWTVAPHCRTKIQGEGLDPHLEVEMGGFRDQGVEMGGFRCM